MSDAVTRLRRGVWRPGGGDAAVGEIDRAVAALGERKIMGDEEKGGAGPLLQREQEVHDVGAGGLVEIAGRLVGKDEGRLWRERPGHGHALLLAAGELAGEMRLAMGEADFGKRRAGGIEGIVAVEELERQRHVLDGRHGRHEVEGLEHDADIGGTETGQIVLVEVPEIGAEHGDAALRCAFEPGDDHEQRRFARARAADHGNRFARRHVQVQSAQYGDGAGAGGKRDMHVLQPDGGLGLFQSLIHGIGSRSLKWHGGVE